MYLQRDRQRERERERERERVCVCVWVSERHDEVEIHTPTRCPGENNASRCARQWDLRNLVSVLNPPFLRPRCISRFKTHVIYSRTEFASGGHNVARNVFAIQINHVANTKWARKKICHNRIEKNVFIAKTV